MFRAEAAELMQGCLGFGGRVTYVIPEEAHGETWRVPKRWTDHALLKRLQEVPCVIGEFDPFFAKKELRQLRNLGCEYELLPVPHQP